MRESLYLIDLYSLIFQVFHAIRDEMSSPDGRPTNAVYGFTRDLITILKEKKPTYLVGAMDSSGPAERNVIYEAYKANRSEMPDDLRPQIPMIGQVLEGFGIPVIEYPGWEADDVIATLVRMAVEREIDVAVITSDKDVRQLLGPHVRMYNMRKRTYMGVAELHADWGIEPGQVVDFQALVGDTVDNIPGVPGIGPKTAATLLNDYRTLDEVLANADKVKGAKARENLKQFADQARISRELARLKVDLPLEVDWERAQAGRINYPRLLELFTEFGFRRFIEDVAALLPEPPPKAGIAPTLQASATLTREWRIVDTPELLAEFAQQFTQQQRFCLDLETTNIDAVRADIVGWAISWEEGRGYYIPVQAPPGQRTLDAKLAIDTLRPHLERTDIQLVNQNVKYDLLVLRRAGIRVGGLGLDPMVGSYLLDSGARSHGQDELSKRYLGHKMIPITDLIGTGKNQCRMCDVDVVRVAEYAVEDAEIAWRLAERIERDLKSEGLWDLYWEIERPLIDVLVAMESNGVRVRSEVLAEQSADVSVRLEQIEQEIYAEAGREFNIASPLHLREVLFKEQGLPVLKRTKTGPSTDQDVLERLALLHPLPAKIIAHRQLAKLKNTYLDALPGMINPETGKIHASFNQTTAATGRLSSSDPNLQNIPIRTAEGRRVRQAFVPSEDGWQLLCADYSQIELRMLAHYSGDAALIEAFQQGADIHTAVAAEIYGVEPDAVTSEMRTIAKAVNFGVIYGQSPFGLAATLGISKEKAGEFIADYFRRYAGVDAFLGRTLDETRKTGHAVTIRGRRRPISGIRPSANRRLLNMPERTAVNAVIQGSAADLIKIAMVNLHRRLTAENFPCRMLLQIHDELVFETPAEKIPELAAIVRQEMEHALELAVPVQVDIAAGSDWLNVTPIDAGPRESPARKPVNEQEETFRLIRD